MKGKAMDLLKRFGFKKEPVFYIALLFTGLFTLYKVLGPDKMPLDDVFSEEYLTYSGALVASLVARMSVFSPASHDKSVEAVLATGQNTGDSPDVAPLEV